MARKLTVLVAIVAIVFIQQHMTSSDASTDTVTAAVQPLPRSVFMRRKLAMVNRIVEGMATDDFRLLEKGGRELAEITESAAWLSDRDPFYQHYSSNFEQAVRGLIKAAESESPEKVTFAYIHVTISCTACHQHVRNADRLSL